MAGLNQDSIRALAQTVVNKAQSDPVARQNLLRAPHATIQQLTGYVVPEHVRIAVVDAEASDVTVVLPPRRLADGELSAQELDQVAGGAKLGGSYTVQAIGNLDNGIPFNFVYSGTP